MSIREKLNSYDFKDIYNMNKSTLYWKMSSERILTTINMSDGKHEKTKILINLTINVFDNHKFHFWFIDTIAKSQCFARSKINIVNFRMKWRSNKKAWMTKRIFKKYILWFDAQMTERKIMLLIDGFSFHYADEYRIIKHFI